MMLIITQTVEYETTWSIVLCSCLLNGFVWNWPSFDWTVLPKLSGPTVSFIPYTCTYQRHRATIKPWQNQRCKLDRKQSWWHVSDRLPPRLKSFRTRHFPPRALPAPYTFDRTAKNGPPGSYVTILWMKLSKRRTVPSLSTKFFWKIGDVFDPDEQIDSLAPLSYCPSGSKTSRLFK